MSRGRPKKHNEGEPCTACGVYPKRFKGYSLKGSALYGRHCANCHRKPHTQNKGDVCELCNYRPLFRMSLDVHHRDGDNKNNDPSNLMTLCANCHRELEASIAELGDWMKAESWLKRFITRIFN